MFGFLLRGDTGVAFSVLQEKRTRKPGRSVDMLLSYVIVAWIEPYSTPGFRGSRDPDTTSSLRGAAATSPGNPIPTNHLQVPMLM